MRLAGEFGRAVYSGSGSSGNGQGQETALRLEDSRRRRLPEASESHLYGSKFLRNPGVDKVEPLPPPM